VFQNHEVNTINLKKRKEPLVGALAKEARVIHFHGSTFVENLDLSDKKVVVQHGGSTYRVDPNACNNIFNLVADATIIQCPDLLNLGAKNEHLIYYPVDTNLIQPDYNPKGSKIIIGHFPSNPLAKGTKGILRVIEKLSRDSEFKKRFKYVGAINHTGKQHQIPWKDHLERMAQCDIIIETMCLNYKGKKFGEWGNAAIESASLGKVVLTNSLTSDIYAKEYGNCALNIINNEEELESKLKRLLSVGQEELMQKKIETREWAVRNHSMTACARRLWNKVYKDFFPELTPSIL
jgi:glycosyltransferase involved in cell wall biosynthesis